jgi:hypothetical protein
MCPSVYVGVQRHPETMQGVWRIRPTNCPTDEFSRNIAIGSAYRSFFEGNPTSCRQEMERRLNETIQLRVGIVIVKHGMSARKTLIGLATAKEESPGVVASSTYWHECATVVACATSNPAVRATR